MKRVILAALAVWPGLAGAARAQGELPVVEDVDWGPLRADCRGLLRGLEADGHLLPADTRVPLRELLDRGSPDPEAAVREVQKLLDPYCLLGISINPESRVKAARGPVAAVLRLDRPALVLAKVHNEAGVTHALAVRGPGIRAGDGPGGRWLEAEFLTEPPFGPKLSGRRLEYRVLRLTAREAGKREVTFQLDVGQGTQDLGFRAEVPVLFTVTGRR
jgi:hypothetical protein